MRFGQVKARTNGMGSVKSIRESSTDAALPTPSPGEFHRVASFLNYGRAVVIAPSAWAARPETYDAAGESRKAAKAPNSLGSP